MIHADRTGQAQARTRPQTEPINWFIIYILSVPCSVQWLHTDRVIDTHVCECMCVYLVWFALRQRVATANAIRLLICHCCCALPLQQRWPLQSPSTVASFVPDPRVPALHCLISGVHYAVFELKLSWFTNEIIRHGRFFGNENSAIREIIFPAFVLFRLPPPLPVLLPCLPARQSSSVHLCDGNGNGKWMGMGRSLA